MNRKPTKVALLGVTGHEELSYQVRLSGGGQEKNLLISENRDKKLQKLLATDLFTFIRVLDPTCVLEDYCDLSVTKDLGIEDLALQLSATENQTDRKVIKRQYSPEVISRRKQDEKNAKQYAANAAEHKVYRKTPLA